MADEAKFVTTNLCNARHSELMAAIGELREDFKGFRKVIYEDNGGQSIQTVLHSHDTAIKVILWLIGVIAAACIAAVAKLVIFGDRLVM